MNSKLAKLEAAQRQIGDQVTELLATVERNCKQSAEETKQTMDQMRSEIMEAVTTKQTEGANKPVYVYVRASVYYLYYVSMCTLYNIK